jgi:hypothetical protein
MKNPAMDAALAKARRDTEAATVARMNAIFTAAEVVAPVAPGLKAYAFDSADAVYKFALDQAGVSTRDIHPSAFKPMVDLVISQQANTQRYEHRAELRPMAHDSKSVDSYGAMFGEFDKRLRAAG